jgi:hypothetical protein
MRTKLLIGFGVLALLAAAAHFLGFSSLVLAPKYTFEENLGNDEYGRLASLIIWREANPPAVDDESEGAQICIDRKSCPLPLDQVYSIGLKRLDEALDLRGKLYLQAQLVECSLGASEKWAILSNTVINSKIHTLPPTSSTTSEGKLILKEDMQYVAYTATHLREIAPSREEYLRVMFAIISNSKDQIARQHIAESLQRGFPKFGDAIEMEAAKLGIKFTKPNPIQRPKSPPADAQMYPPVPQPRKRGNSVVKTNRGTASAKKEKVAKRQAPPKKKTEKNRQ